MYNVYTCILYTLTHTRAQTYIMYIAYDARETGTGARACARRDTAAPPNSSCSAAIHTAAPRLAAPPTDRPTDRGRDWASSIPGPTRTSARTTAAAGRRTLLSASSSSPSLFGRNKNETKRKSSVKEEEKKARDGRQETVHMVGSGDRTLYPAHHRHGHDQHVGQQKVKNTLKM